MRFYSKSFLFFTDLFCKRKNKVNTRKKILIRNPFKNKNYVSGGGGSGSKSSDRSAEAKMISRRRKTSNQPAKS